MPASSPVPAERLLGTARELLRREGLDALSLRRIAREAGVSHGAPLRHFASFAQLCSELAARGFDELSERVEKASEQLAPGAGPAARLRASGHAYLDHAVENPGLFALMFRPDLLDPAHPGLRDRGSASFERIVSRVRAVQDTGWRTDTDSRVLAGSFWAAVHGLAMLWLQRAYLGAVPDASLDVAIDTSLNLLLGDAPASAGSPGGRT